MSRIENVSRRGFLRGVLGHRRPGASPPSWCRPAPRRLRHRRRANAARHRHRPARFRLDRPDGLVTIVAHRAEMGTGVAHQPADGGGRGAGSRLVARESVEQAPGDEKKYGNQDTDGSRSLRHFIQPMREMRRRGAADAGNGGGQALGRAVAEVQALNHEVVHKPSGAQARLRRSRRRRGALPTPRARQLKLKDPKRTSAISAKATSRSSICSTSPSGRAVYGIDRRLPGMKYAVIARPPVLGGKLVSTMALRR